MTLAGQTISDIGKGQFGWPYGIAVNSAGQLVVTDAFSDSVSVYGVNDGKRVRQFGSSGTRDNNFRNPYHVTVDTRDNILVSDCGNDCVKAFDATGRRRFSFTVFFTFRRGGYVFVGVCLFVCLCLSPGLLNNLSTDFPKFGEKLVLVPRKKH